MRLNLQVKTWRNEMKFSEGEVISASFLPELLHPTSWVCRDRMIVVKQATTPPAKGFTSGLLNGAIGATLLSLLNGQKFDRFLPPFE